MIRYQRGGAFTPVSWQEAIRYTANQQAPGDQREAWPARHHDHRLLARHRLGKTNYVMQKVRPRGAEHQ